MKQKRYTDEQIAFALRQAESGMAVAEICRKLGVAEPTFYRRKKQFTGMGTLEIRRLKQLETENAKLKRLVADLSLDQTMLRDVLRKKWRGPRCAVTWWLCCRTATSPASVGPARRWGFTVQRSATRLFEALRGLDYEDGCDAVRRYTRGWTRSRASKPAAALCR